MFLGIDVSKARLDVALIKDEKKPRHKVFANTAAGHQQLLRWLGDNGAAAPVHACLEATGTYSEATALALHEAGHTVRVINPAQIYHFAQTRLSRTKTDKVDAQTIARFCQLHRPPAWIPPAPQVRTLQALVRRLDSLLEMQTTEKNRLVAGPLSHEVHTSIQAVLAFLKAEIAAIQRQIKEHMDNHPDLKNQRDLLTSIPGIAHTSAAALLAELGDVTQLGASRHVAAFAGRAPRIRQSGSSARGCAVLSKRGSSRLRHSLYFPAMAALRFNPLVKALGARLRAKGKAKMLVLGAAMRKLLVIAYGVLKSGKPFDPNFAAKTALTA
jgi:transposase